MLDIETIGNQPGSAIIQVAMVRFARDGNIKDSLSVMLNPFDQLKNGLNYDQSTLDWWNDTNSQKFGQIISVKHAPVKEVLQKINDFLDWNDYIWCHATFDLPLVVNLFNRYGMRLKHKFKNVRDIRTLVDLANLDLSQYNWDAEKTHDALDDCKFQIKYVTDAIKKLTR